MMGIEITREFSDGAKKYRMDDAEWGVSSDGRVYWANETGWDLVMDSDMFTADCPNTLAGADYYYLAH